MKKITGTDMEAMVRHWLNTPAGSYLGSDYGSNLSDFLQQPLSSGLADGVIAKMRVDIPVLQSLPAGSVNIYSLQKSPDRVDFLIEVAGQTIDVQGG